MDRDLKENKSGEGKMYAKADLRDDPSHCVRNKLRGDKAQEVQGSRVHRLVVQSLDRCSRPAARHRYQADIVRYKLRHVT